MDNLFNKKILTHDEMRKLNDSEIQSYVTTLKEGWELLEDSKMVDNMPVKHSKIMEKFKFNGFADAMKFVNRIAEIAEREGHHPDILMIHFNNVEVVLFTHYVGGLTENDFIIAAKIDQII